MSMQLRDVGALQQQCRQDCHHDGMCSCSRPVTKARRHNASFRQAEKLGLLDRIEDRNGSWLIDEAYWWYPQSKKWRPVGGRTYRPARNFSTFWKEASL
jgi:hypothetical protein